MDNHCDVAVISLWLDEQHKPEKTNILNKLHKFMKTKIIVLAGLGQPKSAICKRAQGVIFHRHVSLKSLSSKMGVRETVSKNSK